MTAVCLMHNNKCLSNSRKTGKMRICGCIHRRMIKQQQQSSSEDSLPHRNSSKPQKTLERQLQVVSSHQSLDDLNRPSACHHFCSERTVPCSPSCDSHLENTPSQITARLNKPHFCTHFFVPCTPSCDSH
jgi:hypothetical protein